MCAASSRIDYDFRRVEVVGPAVSGELTKTATLGVLAALAAILIYIWLRFEWQFAVGAIVATLHDVILTLGLFVRDRHRIQSDEHRSLA